MDDSFKPDAESPQPKAAPQAAGDSFKPDPESAVSRFLQPLNPMNVVHAMFKPAEDPKEDPRKTFGRNMIDLVRSAGPEADVKAAVEAYKNGRYIDAMRHAVAGLNPAD